MKMTKHAKIRCQQRALSPELLQVIFRYGRISKASGGIHELFFGNKEYANAINELKKIMKILERAKGGTVIFGGNQVVTVYKQN